MPPFTNLVKSHSDQRLGHSGVGGFHMSIASIWGDISSFLFGLFFSSFLVVGGFVGLIILRDDVVPGLMGSQPSRSRRSVLLGGAGAAGCGLIAIAGITAGVIGIAWTFGFHVGASALPSIPGETVWAITSWLVAGVFAAIGLVLLLKPGLFDDDAGSPPETRTASHHVASSLLAGRPLEAIITPVFGHLPRRVAVRLAGLVWLGLGAIAAAGASSPNIPLAASTIVHRTEAVIALGFYAVLTVLVLTAMTEAIWRRGASGISAAIGCFLVWLVAVAIGLLSGFVDAF